MRGLPFQASATFVLDAMLSGAVYMYVHMHACICDVHIGPKYVHRHEPCHNESRKRGRSVYAHVHAITINKKE